MQIRIIIIGDDNQTHPYEFNSYEDVINFLQGKLPKDAAEEGLEVPEVSIEDSFVEDSVTNEAGTPRIVVDVGLDALSTEANEKVDDEEDKKKEDLLVE